jgi:hypothetical protein
MTPETPFFFRIESVDNPAEERLSMKGLKCPTEESRHCPWPNFQNPPLFLKEGKRGLAAEILSQ